MHLSRQQRENAEAVTRLLSSRGCVLISGPSGTGKRTIAAAAAAGLGLGLREVGIPPDQQSVAAVTRAVEEAGPDVAILVSDLHQADVRAASYIESLVKTRLSTAGIRSGVTPLILHLRTDAPGARIAVASRVCQMTPGIAVDRVLDESELQDLVASIAEDVPDVVVDDAASEGLRLPKEALHVLRRWVQVSGALYGRVDAGSLRSVAENDMRAVVEGLSFKASPLRFDVYQAWVAQFPLLLRSTADRILRAMLEHQYLVDNTSYYRCMEDIVLRSGIPRGANVALCEWQAFGKSGSYVAHELKEPGKWRLFRESIALANDPRSWPEYPGGGPAWIVLADDFVGSGGTIGEIVGRLRLLHARYPGAQIRVLVLVGFIDGLRALDDLRRQLGDERLRVVVSRLLYPEDTCFAASSQVLPDLAERERLGEFCDSWRALAGCGLGGRGYGDLGTLVVFPSSVPNTTVPLLWYDDKPRTWTPLFPVTVDSSAIASNGTED